MALSSEKAKNSAFNRPNIQHCQYCGKECKNINSLKQHEVRCKLNPARKSYNNLAVYIEDYRKGKTKDTCKDIQKQAETLKKKYADGFISPVKGRAGTFKDKKHTKEAKNKISRSVSKTRTEGYSSGRISPARGVGRGKYSYIKKNDKVYMLRSTYEFIYALYLIHNDIDFELEAIRVPALRKNRYTNTFISDFSIGNKVVEIKGIRSSKDIYERESFENAGYIFEELFQEDIEIIKQKLIKDGYDIDSLLEKIYTGHQNKDYYTYIV